MLRRRFTSGLILGLLLGVPSGVLLGILVLPSRPDQGTATTLQVQELTRQLEAAQEDKRRVDRQLEQFQQIAAQMTTSFNSLEQRFKALEEEERLRGARAAITVPPAPTPPLPTPSATPVPAPSAKTPADIPPQAPALP